MQETEAQLRPTVTFSLCCAYLVCLLVLISLAVFGLLGALIVIAGWPHIIPVIIGLTLMLAMWVLRPRLFSMPKELLERSACPNLFELTDQVASHLKIKPVNFIQITTEFNASVAAIGWQRNHLLSIGFPLWRVLDPQERISLISHELAHLANNDPARGTLGSFALQTLDGWIFMFGLEDFEDAGVFGLFVTILYGILSRMLGAIRWILTRLLFIEQQKAEFLADFLAARIAGTSAMVGTLRKIEYAQHLNSFLLASYYAVDENGQTVISKFADFTRSIPNTEIERIKRVCELKKSRIDATHPPTAHRIKFLSTKPFNEPLVLMPEDFSNKIDIELRNQEVKMSERLMSLVSGET